MTGKGSSKRDDRNERIRAMQQHIAEQVAILHDSGQWRRALRYMARFHSYSLNNILLIMLQRPDATLLAGYRQWGERGRHVRKGEKAIRIFGYSTRIIRDENGQPVINKETGEPDRRAWFPIVNVFDVAQTEADDTEHDEYADAVATLTPETLEGDDEQRIRDRATRWLTARGWTVSDDIITGGAKGYTDPARRRIVLNTANSAAQNAKTILHEAAHAILATELNDENHTTGYTEHRGLAETEAESVAYVVAGILGLDTSAYSIRYVAGWSSREPDALRDSAEHVLTAARIIADGIIDAGK